MFLLANRHFRQASKHIPGLAPCQWAERYYRLIYEPCRAVLCTRNVPREAMPSLSSPHGHGVPVACAYHAVIGLDIKYGGKPSDD
jgi:hypothetical protein